MAQYRDDELVVVEVDDEDEGGTLKLVMHYGHARDAGADVLRRATRKDLEKLDAEANAVEAVDAILAEW